MEDVRQNLLQKMALAVEKPLSQFNPATGRFLTEPDGPPAPGAKPEDLGWGVTNQDVLYPLAVLYTTPGTRFHGDRQILDIVLRAGDAIRDFQYPDGQVEFLKPDGSRWGPTYMPWTNYAWLEAYALLRGELDAARRARWEEGLTLAHDGQCREISALAVHNIPCWKGMSCWRAGQLMDRPDWQEAGRAMSQAVVAAQHPDGYWPEHGGPSTLYNYVYVHGLGLYHVFSGDETVLPALRAATEFHQAFLYPDGAPVETVDGRVKHHGHVFPMGWVGFSTSPQGRRLARYLAAQLDPARDCASFQGGSLASSVQHLLAGDEAAIALDAPDFRLAHHGWAETVRRGPWFACLSAFACPPVPSRWGQDRQSFLSLWHADRGLVLGGGNSKDQPEWSTFVADGRFVPDSGELLPDGQGIALTYGTVRCTLRLEMGEEGLLLQANAEAGPALQQFVLQVKPGDQLRTARGLEVTLGGAALAWGPEQLGEWLEFAGIRIALPPGASFRWPTTPFNPYAADGAPAYGEERGLLSARLDGAPLTWQVSQLG